MVKPCRFCGGVVASENRIQKKDWICRECDRKQQLNRRHRKRVAELEQQLHTSVVANGLLRSELYDLRREYNRLTTGRDYGLPDHSRARPPLDSRAESTCTHGVPLPSPCARCGIVEE